jgi:hypothetical protein
MLAEQKQRAPIVVEGYVEVLRSQTAGTALPIARVIPRKYIKGPQRRSYSLNYVPSTCDVPFPTNKQVRQIVRLHPSGDGYLIVDVERLN